MLEPFLGDRPLGVDPELLGVDQAHPKDVSKLSGHEVLVLVRRHSAGFALSGRGEVGLGEFS